MNKILQTIIACLPRYPEEGGTASCVNKQQVMNELINQFGEQVAITSLNLVENFLTSLSLLDNEALQRGEWKFVSHPAQLCALSVLHTLADPNQRLFSAGFWQTAGVGDAEKQQQKQILQALEERRATQHRDDNATPIRCVYVAWALVHFNF